MSGQLNSARAVLQVIDILQGYQPYIGNPVGDFGPLVLAQGGVNDSSGIAYYFDVRAIKIVHMQELNRWHERIHGVIPSGVLTAR